VLVTDQMAASCKPSNAAPRRKARRYWRKLVNRVPALAGVVILGSVVCTAIGAPIISPHDPFAQNLDGRLAPPAWAGGAFVNPLGTDQLGRDELSRLIFGARVSLLVGITAVIVAGATGVIVGVAAGFNGGLIDEILMRFTDLMLALPFTLLIIAVIAVFGPSLVNVIIILGLTGWVPYARVVRAEVLSIREREYVVAAKAVGASTLRVMLRHILPNTIASAIVIASVELSNMILLESSLSFLGLGVQPPTPSWGNMLGETRNYLMSHWWLASFPGIAIAVTAVSINLAGDWLRDVLDPHLVT
jgi:peptide/nickel transport system permease protein